MRTHVSESIEASEQRMRTHVSESIEVSEQRLRGEMERTRTELRTHFDVVTEDLGHRIRLMAEAVAELSERMR